MEALRAPEAVRRHICRTTDQDSIQGRLQAGRHHRLSPARLPPHLGDLALRQEPGPRRADAARRLEMRADGDALRPRQRRRIAAHDQPLPGGNLGDLRKEEEKHMKYILTHGTTPLVRERSRVQSSLAAPFFPQQTSNSRRRRPKALRVRRLVSRSPKPRPVDCEAAWAISLAAFAFSAACDPD